MQLVPIKSALINSMRPTWLTQASFVTLGEKRDPKNWYILGNEQIGFHGSPNFAISFMER